MSAVADRTSQACETFKTWYSRSGHWVYNDRAEAVETWIVRGINGRPRAPEGARELLAGWVAADPVIAIRAENERHAALTLAAFDDMAHVAKRDAAEQRAAIERAARNAL